MKTASPFIVTIDGPAGVGKSTLAKRLAAALGIAYLDTGAMFRTLALHLSENGCQVGKTAEEKSFASGPALDKLLSGCVFALRGAGVETELLCNGVVVGDEIRSEEAGIMAAKIAGLQQVRNHLKAAQQNMGSTHSLVAEGRDMGTVVFPSAPCKIFLEAEPEIRAKRRCLQLKEMGQPCDLAGLTEQICLRDEQDRNRAIAPLRPAGDAIIVDTSNLDVDAVFAAIMRAVDGTGHGSPPAHAVRRKDRTLSHEESLELLARCEYGMLATADKDGWPYAVPLSYVLMDNALYFHCAFTGHKLDNIAWDNRVCFTAVGATQSEYANDFST